MTLFHPKLTAGLLAALLVAPTLAADNRPNGDLDRLQGRWTTKAGPRRNIAVVLEIKDRTVQFEATTPQGLKVSVQGEVRIDETARPKRLDWVHLTALDGQDLPDNLAIYEIEGDTFTLCNGGPNNRRPIEFKPGGGALADLVIFTRGKEETPSSEAR